jgi:hypothetical protein
VWAFLQTEQGQKTWHVAKQGAEWILVASQAPGTEELRAAGCEAAMVSNAGSAVDIFMTLVTEEEKQAEIRSELENQTGEGDLDELLMVVCTLPRFSVGDPGCEEVAQTYANAVDSAPENFFVLVTKQGESELGCQGIYNGDGILIRQPELP